jgi:hypothetical protein
MPYEIVKNGVELLEQFHQFHAALEGSGLTELENVKKGVEAVEQAVKKLQELEKKRIDDLVKDNPPSEQNKKDNQLREQIEQADLRKFEEARLRKDLLEAQTRAEKLKTELQNFLKEKVRDDFNARSGR